MKISACQRYLLAVFFFLALPLPTFAQTTVQQIQERLIHQPLYFRGFWMGRALEFDGSGTLLGDAHDHQKNGVVQGPLTLSGIDVTDVTLTGKKLNLRGVRVALVADESGRLQREALYATTHIVGTLVYKDLQAKQEIKITIHSDDSGSFDAALKAVFANGLQELAPSVPAHWRCYAAGYFAKDTANTDAEKIVTDCVQKSDVAPLGADNSTPPTLLSEPSPKGTLWAGELGVYGVSRIHLIVGSRGFPVRLQIVRALGAGLDESTLQAVSECRFKPASKDGVAVPAGFDFAMTYEAPAGK